MDFQPSERCTEFTERLSAFMDEHVYPAEARVRASSCASPATRTTSRRSWRSSRHARARPGCGTCSFRTPSTARDSPTATTRRWPRSWGAAHIASEACNCSAPDTGNMEVLHQFGTPAQKDRWLRPLLDGEIRSAFAMTEPDVASSDATNIALRIERDGDEYVLNGRKWWTSNALHPHCRIMIVMGKTRAETRPRIPSRARSSCRSTRPASTVMRRTCPCSATTTSEGHGEVDFSDVRVPASNLIAKRGRRVHDRPGAPGPGAHPPLHARDRCGRAGARGDVQASGLARHVRPADRHARQRPGLDRRVAHRDRDGAPAHAEGGLADGHSGQPPRPHRRSPRSRSPRPTSL